jgi:hypothetical protein
MIGVLRMRGVTPSPPGSAPATVTSASCHYALLILILQAPCQAL